MLNRRLFIALASGLFVPSRAYSFAGGWALPFSFLELSDGRIIECVRKPAVRLANGMVMPTELAVDRTNPVQQDCYFPLRHDGSVMGWAGGNPREANELRPLIVRARCGELESWWNNGERIDGGSATTHDGPQAYL